ncbi:MAG TPA: tRNA preQ1(34) S-adenosylmethionine ribosyltransferase-isomerase QueA [Verrucomicrobiae bacterium]|nr:tRNA preQ1(34) S-adenosylmethionine ribosyltransferase-isomerase QueA [Verrucomicrobiae bacterium]
MPVTLAEHSPAGETDRRLSSYDYDLPPELIAAHPPEKRTSARLMKIGRETGAVEHRRFGNVADFLKAGDVLVLNDTKVIPARLLGRRPTGGKVQALLLKETGPDRWEALLKPSGRIAKGQVLAFEGKGVTLEARVDDEPAEHGVRTLVFPDPDFRKKLEIVGHMPLPPYIEREDTDQDREDYQTVFARAEGAVAAPTAGLHFDKPLLETLRQKGVEIVFITLHTGYGTFQPVYEEDVTQHEMFEEFYSIDAAAAEKINAAKREKRRVIACGTTTVRALESAAREGSLQAGQGLTRIFIYPPYAFRVMDGLITNFHLPKSTLLMLVASFLGREKMMAAYHEAVREKYAFYSYGDAMVIL